MHGIPVATNYNLAQDHLQQADSSKERELKDKSLGPGEDIVVENINTEMSRVKGLSLERQDILRTRLDAAAVKIFATLREMANRGDSIEKIREQAKASQKEFTTCTDTFLDKTKEYQSQAAAVSSRLSEVNKEISEANFPSIMLLGSLHRIRDEGVRKEHACFLLPAVHPKLNQCRAKYTSVILNPSQSERQPGESKYLRFEKEFQPCDQVLRCLKDRKKYCKEDPEREPLIADLSIQRYREYTLLPNSLTPKTPVFEMTEISEETPKREQLAVSLDTAINILTIETPLKS